MNDYDENNDKVNLDTKLDSYKEEIDDDITREIEIITEEPETIVGQEGHLILNTRQKDPSVSTLVNPENDDQVEDNQLTVPAEKRLKKIAIGMYPSFVLAPSREPFRLNSFYQSVKVIHDALESKFSNPPSVNFVLASSDYSRILQEENVLFKDLEELLTEREEKSGIEESVRGESRGARFQDYKLEPGSHVTYKIDNFAHIHVNYEKYNPYKLLQMIPGDGLHERLKIFFEKEGNIKKKELIKSGVLGLATGIVTAYLGSFNIIYALIAGVGSSVAKLSFDLASNPIYCATIDCELTIDSTIPIEDRPQMAGRLESFIETMNGLCSFQYIRDSRISDALRMHVRDKAAAAAEHFK